MKKKKNKVKISVHYIIYWLNKAFSGMIPATV